MILVIIASHFYDLKYDLKTDQHNSFMEIDCITH